MKHGNDCNDKMKFFVAEDNNTRVLFERVLSSGGLTPQLSVEVWNRFLEFESNIGDLSSIVKVERRRSSVLENVNAVCETIEPKNNFFPLPLAERIRRKGNRATG